MIFIAGHAARKWKLSHSGNCDQCKMLVVENNRSSNVEYDAKLLRAFDRGGLVWPTSYAVRIGVLCIDVVECIISNDDLQKKIIEDSKEGSIVMNVLKSIMKRRVLSYHQLSAFKQLCSHCNKDRSKSLSNHFISTFFNIGFDKLSVFLSREQAISCIMLSMVKSGKKNKSISYAKIGNNSVKTNSGQWACHQCKKFLESHGVVRTGLVSDSRDRCATIMKLDKIGFSCIWKSSKK